VKTKFIVVILLGFLSFPSFSQVSFQEGATPLERMYSGGGFGLNFNRDVFSLSLSPILGYMITQRVSAGIGIPYQFNSYSQIDIQTNDFGARLFGRFQVIDQLFAYTEFEYLNFEFVNIQDPDNNIRQGFDSYFFGLGYSSPRPGTQFNIMGMYNILWQENVASPYNSPWSLRVQVTIPLGGIGRRRF
jgi:hypothetical protein